MSQTYLGNPQLKKSNVALEFTKEQIEEYLRCSNSVEYFTETYIKIVNVDRGLVSFNMYDFQRKMINTFALDRFVIAKCPRQSGKTTTVTSFLLWKALFFDNQNVAILANKGRLAMDILSKVRLAYENLPKWLQQGVIVWNKGNIELENGSKMLAAATSSSAIRGGSYNCILLDEFSFVPRNIAENFFASVYPTITSGMNTQVIIVSTPNGLNHYYKMWMDAVQKRSLYTPIEVHWRQIPGRDDAWKSQTIRNTSEQQFRAEFETEFLGSANTLISPTKIRELVFITPKVDKWGLDIYQEPIKDHTYTMTVDTAHGVGLDYSAFSIIDVSQIPYNLVAKYRNNKITPSLYPEILYRYATWYNNAFVLIEVNDVGQLVVNALHDDLEYENVLSTVNASSNGPQLSSGFSGKTNSIGIRMTKQVKRIGCSNIKEIVESDKLLIQDFDVIEEFSSFISRGSSYEAEEGYNDDMVMTLVLFGWLSRQSYFKELTNTDIRARLARDKYSQMEDDLIPAGFFDDGSTSESMRIDARDIDDIKL